MNSTAKIESILKHSDSITLDAAVFDNTTKVKTLTKDNSNWNGKWDNGTNNNKFANPKKYTIKAKFYKDTAKTKEIDSMNIDVFVARLGIEKLEFDSHSGGIYVPMQFHTTEADIDSGLSTAAAKWKYDAAWQLSNEETTLNVDNSDGSAALVESAIYTETFYPKMPTATTSMRSTYYNYPICYVKNSKIKIKPTLSNNYVSHLTGNAATGTIPTDAPDIYLKVKKKTSNGYGTEKQTTNKITAGTTVELELDDAAKNSVGNETIEFEYNWFYKDGTTDIDIPGNFKSTHKIYTIVNTPHTPWGITTGSEYPWLAVVDIATSNKMAEGVTCTTANLKPLYTKMEKAMYELEGNIGKDTTDLMYDIINGASNYSHIDNNGYYSRLSNFLLFLKPGNEPNNSVLCSRYTVGINVINCTDCATLLMVFTNILGGNLQCGLIVPASSTVTEFDINPIVPVGYNKFVGFLLAKDSSFSFHLVTTPDAVLNDSTKVYDFCLKLGTPDPTKYLSNIKATETNCKLSDGLPFFNDANLTISPVVRKV
ncbi:MAG: hypothetical protein LBE12_20570, partial [Planctomycetaceae bacterium]|nr:hypothetical protein [Planctomycetaceae bacterium]